MSTPSLTFLSSVISLRPDQVRRAMRVITQKGFESGWLVDPEYKKIYRWMVNEYTDYGELPKARKFADKFPHFRWTVMDNVTFGELESNLDDLRQFHASKKIEDIFHRALAVLDKDPLKAAAMAREDLIRLTASSEPIKAIDLAEQAENIRNMYLSGGIAESSLTWPWPSLQKETGGLHPGEFIVFAGRPKSMKTFFMMYVSMWNYLQHGARILFVSRELPAETLALRRLAAMAAQVDYSRWKSGSLAPDEERRAFTFLDNLREMEANNRSPIRNDLSPGFRVITGQSEHFSSTGLVESAMEDFRPDMVADDGFYLAAGGMDTRGSSPMDWKFISALTQWAKRTAVRYNAVYMASTQANRQSEKSGKSSTSVFAFSDSFAQDSDLGMRIVKRPAGEGYPQHALFLLPAFREGTLEYLVVNAVPCTNMTEVPREMWESYGIDTKKLFEEEDEFAADDKDMKKDADAGTVEVPDIPTIPKVTKARR